MNAVNRPERILKEIGYHGFQGRTVKELRRYFDLHHGTISSVLTNLNRAGKIVRLEERRDGASIYVLPGDQRGRTAASPRRTQTELREVTVHLTMTPTEVGAAVVDALLADGGTEQIKVVLR